MNSFTAIGFTLIIAAAGATIAEKRNLDGFQVLSVTAVTPTQFSFLKSLQENDDLDFWTHPKYQGVTDIMVSPAQKKALTGLLASKNIKWSVKISDLGARVAAEKKLNDAALEKAQGEMSWDAYHRYEEIVQWLQEISSHELVTLSVIGQSYEGRDLHMVTVSTGRLENNDLKPVIFIDANFHAREWVSGASATWIINEVITNSDLYTNFFNKYDLAVVPLANPDGYEYTHDVDRRWRKTRSLNVENADCPGVDPNRNFAFHYGGENTSDRPCSDQYKGTEAFSEPETAAIRDAIKRLQTERIVHAYYTIHSYGQLWLLSWGYEEGAYPDDFPELLTWGEESVGAIRNVHGETYDYGQGADLLYAVGGASDDWAKNEGVKYVACLEVRDKGRHGFLLPPDQIIPNAQEIWAGIQVVAQPEYDQRP